MSKRAFLARLKTSLVESHYNNKYHSTSQQLFGTYYIMKLVNFDLKEFGLAVSKARLAKNINAAALGQMINKSRGYMYVVEKGTVNLSMDALVNICNCIGLDPRDFFVYE